MGAREAGRAYRHEMSGRLHAELVAGTASGCKLCRFLATLPPAEAADWRAELALPVAIVGNSAIAHALGWRGVFVTEASVRRHRANHA